MVGKPEVGQKRGSRRSGRERHSEALCFPQPDFSGLGLRRWRLCYDSGPGAEREKPLAQTLSFSQRKIRLIAGSLTAFFPPFIWWAWSFALGDDFIQKHAALYYRLVEPEEIYLFLLVCGGLLELVALFILERSRQKPRDWISILAVIVGVCSILLVMFFFAFSTGIIFGGS